MTIKLIINVSNFEPYIKGKSTKKIFDNSGSGEGMTFINNDQDIPRLRSEKNRYLLKNLLTLDSNPFPQVVEHSDHLDHSDVAHMSSGRKSSGAET